MVERNLPKVDVEGSIPFARFFPVKSKSVPMRILCLICLGLLLVGCKPSTAEKELEGLDRRMTVLNDRIVILEINCMKLVNEIAHLRRKAEEDKANLEAALKAAKTPPESK